MTPGLRVASQTDEISAACRGGKPARWWEVWVFIQQYTLFPPWRSFILFFLLWRERKTWISSGMNKVSLYLECSCLGGPGWRQSFLPFSSPPVSCSCLMGSSWQPMTRSAVSSADKVLQFVLGSRRRPSQTEYQDAFDYCFRKNYTGIGCVVSSFLTCQGKKIDRCALLIRQEMFSFHLRGVSGFKCIHVCACVCVRTWHAWPLQKKDRCCVWIWRRLL